MCSVTGGWASNIRGGHWVKSPGISSSLGLRVLPERRGS